MERPLNMPLHPWLARVLAPNWMPEPDSWVWRRPCGMIQGFGLTWRERVGLANLQWLALDMRRPPQVPFEARNHGAYMLAYNALPELVELAEMNSLQAFHDKLAARPHLARIHGADRAPLYLLLAERRLRHGQD
jgi:hypothetical protein